MLSARPCSPGSRRWSEAPEESAEFHGTAPPPIPPVARARLAVPPEPPVWGMAFLVPAGGREHEGLSFLLRVHSVHAVSCAACAAAAHSLGVGRPRRCGHQSHRNVCCVFFVCLFLAKACVYLYIKHLYRILEDFQSSCQVWLLYKRNTLENEWLCLHSGRPVGLGMTGAAYTIVHALLMLRCFPRYSLHSILLYFTSLL